MSSRNPMDVTLLVNLVDSSGQVCNGQVRVCAGEYCTEVFCVCMLEIERETSVLDCGLVCVPLECDRIGQACIDGRTRSNALSLALSR